MSKYHSVKWHGYDSKKEAKRAEELKAMQEAGEIEDLQEQVIYEIIPAQWEDVPRVGKKGQPLAPKKRCIERSCHYIADFVYKKDGRTVVEDTKGVRTPDYVIKRKLMLLRFGIKIHEI